MTIRPHHVGLTVEDLDAIRGFYERALGFAVVLEFELSGGARGAMLRTPGGAGVELFEVPGSGGGVADVDPPTSIRTRGYGHLALEVDDLDVVFAAVNDAGAREVWAPQASPEAGKRMAFVHDPAGNLIELIGPA